MQPRSLARELALLTISQLPTSPEKLAKEQMYNIMLAAIRALANEVQEALENAAVELKRGSDRLLASETRANDVQSARAMVNEAIELTQNAINRVGTAVELPEFIYLANQQQVRDYALEIISTVNRQRTQIDELLSAALVDWQLNRLARLDRDILRIAVAEILFLDAPKKVAINEAVDLAKRYSDEEGKRFINGVLRRVSDRLKVEC
ncbi:MAG: transcription antitermination factor NusB [Cyanosarcina radialis HA8281-LM2]|jgi:N utilization substance protein B|nr:transcription antitermination factor NusB [Cyanosarcina radialis HA8281-LM2]